jgi:hypothetical protein
MNIKVLHYYTNEVAELAKLTATNIKAYCNIHGYNHVEDTKTYHSKNTFDTLKHNSKFDSIRANLKDCDYLLWLDADILIMNPDIEIESFISSEASIIQSMYADVAGKTNYFHNGFMLFKNDDKAHRLQVIYMLNMMLKTTFRL